MLVNSILLDYWFLAPTVSITCEVFRWLSKSSVRGLHNEKHWIHLDKTPRIGGICIFLALFMGYILFWDRSVPDNHMLGYFVAIIPIFSVGVIEDIFGGVSALTRLLFTSLVVMFACGVSFYFYGVSGQNQSLFFLMPFLFFCLCAGGVGLIHGTNLIDGLNGLAVCWGIGAAITMWICVMNSTIFSLADKELVLNFVMIFCICLIGFFFVNFPFGRVFLGDSGAYLIGFSVFVLGAIVIMHSPDSQTILKISAACSYPLMEIGWTVIRRVLINRTSVFTADNAHLHSLIFTNMRRRFSALSVRTANNLASIVTFLFVIQTTFWVSVMLPADFWSACLVWLFCPASYLTVYYFVFYRGVSLSTR